MLVKTRAQANEQTYCLESLRVSHSTPTFIILNISLMQSPVTATCLKSTTTCTQTQQTKQQGGTEGSGSKEGTKNISTHTRRHMAQVEEDHYSHGLFARKRQETNYCAFVDSAWTVLRNGIFPVHISSLFPPPPPPTPLPHRQPLTSSCETGRPVATNDY